MSTLIEIAQMIEDCEKRESKLTDWEREFISDIEKKFSSDDTTALSLTKAQDDKLTEIWDRVTS